MALQIDGILFDTLTADPGSPAEGQVWYNTTTKVFGIYRNGAVTYFTDFVQFNAHASGTGNPHSTTLEQARTAGSTLAGAINMGGFAITNVAAGSNPTDGAQRQWVTDQVNQKVAGLDWQESVLNRLTTPPGSPVTGDRYLVIATATGAWLGQENKIAEWSGSAWTFATPNEGWVTRVEAENLLYTYDGATWGNLGGAVSHSALLNLTADDHLQYLPRSGARPMTGNLDMGAQSITNVNLVDGVDVSAHAARHQPGGADAIPTAAPGATSVATAPAAGTSTSLARADHVHQSNTAPVNVTKATAAIGTSGEPARADHKHDVSTGVASSITDSTNSEGTATSLSRSDHGHAHGTRGGGTLHAQTSATGAGFYPQSAFNKTTNPTVTDDGTAGYVPGSRWVNTTNATEWVCISNGTGAAVWSNTLATGGYLVHKAGRVLAATFAGNPKKATVTFTTPFADANYSVVITPVTTGNIAYTPVLESQLAGSFVINVTTNNIPNLTQMNWVAVKHGEST